MPINYSRFQIYPGFGISFARGELFAAGNERFDFLVGPTAITHLAVEALTQAIGDTT